MRDRGLCILLNATREPVPLSVVAIWENRPSILTSFPLTIHSLEAVLSHDDHEDEEGLEIATSLTSKPNSTKCLFCERLLHRGIGREMIRAVIY
jgi:hypothetical protein